MGTAGWPGELCSQWPEGHGIQATSSYAPKDQAYHKLVSGKDPVVSFQWKCMQFNNNMQYCNVLIWGKYHGEKRMNKSLPLWTR